MLEKVADSAFFAPKLAEPYKPYGGQFLEFCSISLSTYQTCMKLTRKSTEFCQFFCRHYPPSPSVCECECTCTCTCTCTIYIVTLHLLNFLSFLTCIVFITSAIFRSLCYFSYYSCILVFFFFFHSKCIIAIKTALWQFSKNSYCVLVHGPRLKSKKLTKRESRKLKFHTKPHNNHTQDEKREDLFPSWSSFYSCMLAQRSYSCMLAQYKSPVNKC